MMRTLCLGLLAGLLTACATSRAPDQLYQELGQTQGIDALVTELLDVVYADDRIAFLFQETDRPALHDLIVEQVCMETGGPCDYTGLPMDEAHSGFEIKESEFDAFVEDFIIAMENRALPVPVQNRVLRIFAPMRDEVIYR